MRIYVDDCLDGDLLIALLTNAGHDVVTPRSVGTSGILDPDHLASAAHHGLILLTKNPGDFRQPQDAWMAQGRAHKSPYLPFSRRRQYNGGRREEELKVSESHHDDAWQLYRRVVKERDTARAELDTLRLLTLEVIAERDEARALVQQCYELLRRIVHEDGRIHRDRWEELDQLRDKLRPLGWIPETPALEGETTPVSRCSRCGLRLPPGETCLLCDPTSDQSG